MFDKLKFGFLNSFTWKVMRDNVKLSYSRAGLDMVLGEIFKGRQNGYYVDIGCYKPVYDSNTFRFYQKGWSGLAIDANPKMEQLFNQVRKRDVFLNCIVTNNEGVFDYYSFNDPGYDQMNTISAEYKDMAIQKFNLKEPNCIQIQGYTLENILDKNKPEQKNFDLLCIDVEGAELNILESNNWEKYLPEVVLIEVNNTLNDMAKDAPVNYLLNKGYILLSYVVLDVDKGNAFLVHESSELLQSKRF